MIIQWLGQQAFKITEKDVTLAIDPHDKSGLKMSKFQADILLITDKKSEFINPEIIKGDPFTIDGAGEYEVKNVFIYGLKSFRDNKKGKDKGGLTSYVIEIDGVKIGHLGEIGQDNLTERQLEKLEGIDILLIPVGGGETLDGANAAKIISQLQPRVVIPTGYKTPGLKLKADPLDAFLKEYGVEKTEKLDKYKISKKDLPQEDTQVVILNKV